MYSSTTKGSYRHNSAKKQKKVWLIVILGLLGVGFIFPWLISLVAGVILYPFYATSLWVKTGDGILPAYFRSQGELVAEVDALKTRLATEAGTKLSINRLLEENMQLRAMAEAGESDGRMVARVISRPGTLSYDVLQIDKGSDDGVVIGAPVYTGIDTVVGMVVHVTSDYSFVDLFTSPGFLSTAFIFGPNVFSPIEGMGGGVARVKLPQGVALASGQLVILPGVSSGIYGEIVSVQSEPTQPEQYGYITSPVSISSLLYVSVGNEIAQVRTDSEINEDVRAKVRSMLKLSSSTISAYASSTLVEIELDETVIVPIEQ
jgi:cell shape-determining protein MreC